ncbi:MAG: polysaccharide biosynthesis/export family protein [Hyphomicrobium sp.]|jgi:protein involved in polysaccharide export with SLBB domain
MRSPVLVCFCLAIDAGFRLAGCSAVAAPVSSGDMSSGTLALPAALEDAKPPQPLPRALDLRLAPGDKLSIKIVERPDVAGEYRVREDGLIVMPLIGAVTASGKSLVELEREIAALGGRILLSTPTVLLDVLEWRPITVLGAVDKPGSYPFKGQMTVIHALAAAGGLFRPGTAATLMIDLVREKTQYGQAESKLKRALARKARIEAEISGLDDIPRPARLAELTTVEEAKSLLLIERRIMQQRRISHETRVKALDGQIALVDRETVELTNQLGKVAEQLRLLDKELELTETLSSKGLSPRSRTLERQLQIASMQATQSSTVAQRLRADQDRQNAQRDRDLLLPELKVKLEEELKLVEDEVLTQELAMSAAQTMIARIGELQVKPGVNTDSGAHVAYELSRAKASGTEVTTARETTALLPGDVVRVLLLQ